MNKLINRIKDFFDFTTAFDDIFDEMARGEDRHYFSINKDGLHYVDLTGKLFAVENRLQNIRRSIILCGILAEYVDENGVLTVKGPEGMVEIHVRPRQE